MLPHASRLTRGHMSPAKQIVPEDKTSPDYLLLAEIKKESFTKVTRYRTLFELHNRINIALNI